LLSRHSFLNRAGQFHIRPQAFPLINLRRRDRLLRTKTGISKVYFIELPKDIQERFHYDPRKTVAAQREREPIKIEAKQDESRQTDQGGWAGALSISARFVRLLAVGALVITGVVLFIVRSRF
jgi:hypothetical protein